MEHRNGDSVCLIEDKLIVNMGTDFQEFDKWLLKRGPPINNRSLTIAKVSSVAVKSYVQILLPVWSLFSSYWYLLWTQHFSPAFNGILPSQTQCHHRTTASMKTKQIYKKEETRYSTAQVIQTNSPKKLQTFALGKLSGTLISPIFHR